MGLTPPGLLFWERGGAAGRAWVEPGVGKQARDQWLQGLLEEDCLGEGPVLSEGPEGMGQGPARQFAQTAKTSA